MSIFVTDRYFGLDHEKTGIQLAYEASERISITAPYGDSDAKTDAVMRLMYQLGRVVEEVTGLKGYDPQLGLPLSDAVDHADHSLELFDTVGAMMARRERTAARARERQRSQQSLITRWMRRLTSRWWRGR